MNCELEYQAWVLLDQLDFHPEIEDRKRLIVDRTLQRIELASSTARVVSRHVIDLPQLLRAAGTGGGFNKAPVGGVNAVKRGPYNAG